MEDFVPFEIAKKLEEKGFTLPKSNVVGKFDSDGIFHSQLYINFTETMDSEEIIAPTISQVLKWLRDNHKLHISTKPYPCEDGLMWLYEIRKFNKYISAVVSNKTGFTKEEQAALTGIECVLDNLI